MEILGMDARTAAVNIGFGIIMSTAMMWGTINSLSRQYQAVHLKYGNDSYSRKDYADALTQYNEVIRVNPKEKKAFFNRALVYSARGDFDRPSRPGEFHPEPLTDPDLILTHHPAPCARRLAAE